MEPRWTAAAKPATSPAICYPHWMDSLASTVLWRLRNDRRERAHAAILPGGPPHTLTFFVNDTLDRAENYDTLDLALFRADQVQRSMLEDRWKDEP